MLKQIGENRAKFLRNFATHSVEWMLGQIRYAPDELKTEEAREEEDHLYQRIADNLGVRRVSESMVLRRRTKR